MADLIVHGVGGCAVKGTGVFCFVTHHNLNPRSQTMKYDVNKVILVGTVGRHPELDDDPVVLSLRTTSRTGDAQWHRLVCRDHIARFATDQVRCGDRLYVEGTLAHGAYLAEVLVNEVVLLDTEGRQEKDQ